MEETEKNTNMLKYILSFVGKSFIISIICFLILICIILVIYFGDLFFNLNSNSKKSPLFNGYVIVSQSMVPTININDGIVVKRIDKDKYKVGDIISFSSSNINYRGLTITHRIIDKKNVSVDNSIYTTKGDNNLVADKSTVLTNQIYGKVLFVIPKIGYIQYFFKRPSNVFILFFIGVALIIIYDILKISNILVKRERVS